MLATCAEHCCHVQSNAFAPAMPMLSEPSTPTNLANAGSLGSLGATSEPVSPTRSTSSTSSPSRSNSGYISPQLPSVSGMFACKLLAWLLQALSCDPPVCLAITNVQTLPILLLVVCECSRPFVCCRSALPAAEEQSPGQEGAASAPVCTPADACRVYRLHKEAYSCPAAAGAQQPSGESQQRPVTVRFALQIV